MRGERRRTAIAVRSRLLKDVEVVEGAALNDSAERADLLGRRVRLGQADDLLDQ